jgi:hypothetical protein
MRLPDAEAIMSECRRRHAAALRAWFVELNDPEWPAWPPQADDNPRAWMRANWSQAALDDYDTLQRALFLEKMDTVIGSIALAVWEARRNYADVARLLASVGLTTWPAGASEEQADEFRRRNWGAWEFVYYADWQEWAPLSPVERQSAHAKSWREHLAGEAHQERWLGRCWWRTMQDPNPGCIVAHVDTAAGLRLAHERGHDETYPRPDDEGDEEE